MMHERRRKPVRYLRALVRDWTLLLREFWWPLVGMSLLTLVVALLFKQFYGNAQIPQGTLEIDEAIYLVVTLTVLESAYLPPTEHHWLVIFYFLMPIFGVIFAGQGLLNFLTLLFNRQARGQAWRAAQASTLSDHYVVMGVGHVGNLVIRELVDSGAEVVGVERDLAQSTVQEVVRQGVIVLEGDARQHEALRMAGIERAASAIICMDDDLGNLECAIRCRDLNPTIRTVVRMYDPELARRVRATFGIDAAFSSSALAAPIFAGAALDLEVHQSFYIGDRVMSVARLDIQAGSQLDGMTVDALVHGGLELSIIAHVRDGQQNLHPPDSLLLHSGDGIVALADLPTLTTLAARNQPKGMRSRSGRRRLRQG